MQSIYLYFISIPIFITFDLLWLGVVARGFYASQLGELLGPINWAAAAVFYLIFLVGLLIFAIQPGLDHASVWRAVILGALFGFVAYATYDLTNLATLKNWPLTITIIDMVWGAVLGGVVSGLTVLVGRMFL